MYKFYKLLGSSSFQQPANAGQLFPIQLRDVHKYYDSGSVQTPALRGINLQISQGDFLAIMGPSGCGKTTLLNLLGMIDVPTSGSIYLNDQAAPLSEKARTILRRNHIGMVFQQFNLVEELNVYENIVLPLRYKKNKDGLPSALLKEWMQRLRLWHRRYAYPHELSGGQQQKVALLRALVSRPALLLADEPTGNLDSTESAQVMQLMQELHHSGELTIVMVTHAEQWAHYTRRIVYMLDGKIIGEKQT
ncbi:putative ABC transport system ATP-binding protein [Thermonema lapsum]|uniref:Putative ABC transport system ATP-binding protein n=1 Tax=Thermonema lapsum TaxID=28195 RepID=A0A846MQW8_9BACT|nr:ABC transporter ATP-binding protein [Thermonema lapsum]NIK73966.1 putative ABC transport system ATP-binding protein [Thermonema lapsum]